MTPREFKIWLEGFVTGLDGPPNQEQWDKVKESLAQWTDVQTFTASGGSYSGGSYSSSHCCKCCPKIFVGGGGRGGR